jgi:DNA-binding MarR family transcriptional regulator
MKPGPASTWRRHWLARGAFVTRQSMNVLLQTLEREGHVTRPAEAPVGKVLPTRLTPRGRRSLEKATVAVRSVEVGMLAGLTGAGQAGAFRILRGMVRSLRDGNDNVQCRVQGSLTGPTVSQGGLGCV